MASYGRVPILDHAKPMMEAATACSTSGGIVHMFYVLVSCNRWLIKEIKEGGSSVMDVRCRVLATAQELYVELGIASSLKGRAVN